MRAGVSTTPFSPGELVLPPAGLYDANTGFNDRGGKAVRPLALNPGVRNLVLIMAGQSNMCSVGETAYAPANGAVLDNFNLYDGGMYAASDPLLGSGYLMSSLGFNSLAHLGTRLGDALIAANKFDRVILAPCAVGATTVADWTTGRLANRLPATIRRLASRGIVSGTNVTIAVLWGQGESDALTLQATYTASLNQLISNARAAGHSGRIFIAIQSRGAGVNYANVRAAQVACVNNGAGVYAGPDADAITTGRYGDGTHFDTVGLASLTTAWQAALAASGAPF